MLAKQICFVMPYKVLIDNNQLDNEYIVVYLSVVYDLYMSSDLQAVNTV